MTARSRPAHGWLARALGGFFIGVVVCLTYWASGAIPRDLWFDQSGTDELIRSKLWLWPSAVLDVLLRDVPQAVAAIALYSLNGLTYAGISVSLYLLRRNWIAYAIVSIVFVGLLTWFNVAMLENFSWLWLAAVCVTLGAVASRDLRSPHKPA